MSNALLHSGIRQVTVVAVLLAALTFCWLAYAPGISGTLHFDDRPNLEGLAEVQDLSSGLRFVMSGRAGPLGRPVALATFAPQAYAWPDAPEIFLRTNVLIHLLNGILVTWFLYLLGLATHSTQEKASTVAVASGALWMLLPILASSSLFIVQRMTTLSAAFVLLGAIVYLYARRSLEHHPVRALIGMTLALGCGATLAALAKENGALLFLLVLATEATLLARPQNVSRIVWRTWFGAVLIVPAVLVVAYLAMRSTYSIEFAARRGFTGFERLITQAEILWKYVFLSFLPSVPGLVPFSDDYPVQRSLLNPVVLLAVAGWIGSIAAAFLLRRRFPLLGFALAWFLAGHLLESSPLPLELYFEHRNYVPLIGPTYALVAIFLYSGEKLRRLAFAAIAAYCVVLGGVLYSVTSLWGNPHIAAEMWNIYRPSSIRAAEMLASELELKGDPRTAAKVLRDALKYNPDALFLDFRAFLMTCQLDAEVDHTEAFRDYESKLKATSFSYATTGLLTMTSILAQYERCGLDNQTVERMGESLLENPLYGAPAVRHDIHLILANAAMDSGDPDLTVAHIEQALRLYQIPWGLKSAADLLEGIGSPEAFARVIAEARHKKPTSRLRTMLWDEQINRLEELKLRAEHDLGKSTHMSAAS